MAPMALNGQEAVGSMGTDTPLAVLSNKPQLLFNYFKQLFAQVTNPPIDPIREELVMSLKATIGAEQNLFEETPAALPAARARGRRSSTTPTLAQIKALQQRQAARRDAADALSRSRDGGAGLREGARRAVLASAEARSPTAPRILVLSDRGVDEEHAPIPSLLATAAVHHHLIREGTRTRCGLVVESGEPREVHALRAAGRLRRRRGQPVPRVRDARRA